MATGTASPGPLAPQPIPSGAINGVTANRAPDESYIDEQLRKTRAHVKAVDVASGLMTLAAGSLACWLVAAILDHWILPGGLGYWGRLLCFVLYFGVAGYYFVRQVLPLFIKRINPLYAAQTIEHAQPTLKNSVLNFLFFREQRATVPDGVYQALQTQAAAGLHRAPVDTAVDRSQLIKLGYLLLGILAACCAYKVLSPKDPFQTLGRVMLPWADLQVSSRVTIDDVQPGDQTAYRGQQVKISAKLRGLSTDETVYLVFSTADGQFLERSTPMRIPQGGMRHEGLLPGGETGLQADAEYWIKAGDAVTKHYHLPAIPTPTITVERLDFDYPDYTRFEHHRVEQQGDIKELEGTRVTIHAVANHPIKEAFVDFECDNKDDLKMKVDGQTAVVSFNLAFAPGDRQTPEHTSYQLRFVTTAGHRNPEPVRHKIEVIPDLSPEITILSPKADELTIPLNGRETFDIQARDPDFLLQSVQMVAKRDGQLLNVQELLVEPSKNFLGKFEFIPQKLKLQAGDELELWASAMDNKTPEVNQTETAAPHKKIHIVAADPRQNPQPNGGQQNQPQKNPNDQPNQGNQPDNKKGNDPNQKNQPNKGNEKGQPQNGGQGQDDPNNPPKQGDNNDQNQNNNPSDNKDNKNGSNDSKNSKGNDANSKPDLNNNGPKGGGDSKPDQNSNGMGGDNNPDNKPEKGNQPNQGSQDNQPNNKGDKGNNDPANSDKNNADKNNSDKNNPNKNGGEQNKDPNNKGDKNSGGGEPNGNSPDNSNQPNNEANPSAKGGAQGQPNGGESQQRPVAADGSNDPDAIKAIKDHQDAQGENKQGTGKPGENQKASGDPHDKGLNPAQNPQPGDQNQNNPGQSPNDKSTDKSTDKSNDKPSDKANGTPDKNDPNNSKPSPGGSGEKDLSQSDSAKSNPGESGQDDKGTPNKFDHQDKSDPRDKAGNKEGSSAEKPQDKSGQAETQTGDPGAGEKGKKNDGSPDPQAQNAGRDQQPSDKQNDKKGGSEEDPAQSPSNSEKQPKNGKQGIEGDKSGPGKKGGGAKSNVKGQGQPGQNETAETGEGKSPDGGGTEKTQQAGTDAKSDNKTGQKGTEKGPGSPAPGDQDSNAKDKTDKASKNGGEKGKPGDQPGTKPATSPDGKGNSDVPLGGGQPSGEHTPQKWQPGQDPSEDPANLEYAKKATDLVLEKLKNQMAKGSVDQELLDKLGWSKQDMENFLHRWEKMKADAVLPGREGEKGKQQLDEAVRSLGLRKDNTTSGPSNRDDALRGLRDAPRTAPPPEYQDQFRKFNQGK